MNDTRYGRFKDSPWFGKPLPPIIVGGAGGIGSWFMILLMRSGDHQVMLMDPDIVEDSNLAGQFYTESDIGKTKVAAVSDHVDRMCGNKPGLFYNTERYLPGSEATPIMVSCFDNMQARQDMFANWEKHENPKLFIDGRMNAEAFQLFAVTPKNAERYKEHLYDDSSVPDLACSYKATSHTAAMLAGKMVAVLNNWICIDSGSDTARELPFFIKYDLSLMMETVEI